ncbi:hypothetical protein D3C76_1228900 [compost metagenome]
MSCLGCNDGILPLTSFLQYFTNQSFGMLRSIDVCRIQKVNTLFQSCTNHFLTRLIIQHVRIDIMSAYCIRTQSNGIHDQIRLAQPNLLFCHVSSLLH